MHESLDHDPSLAGRPRVAPAGAASDDLRDRALIARVAAGDELAFEQLVRLHRPRLLRIAERVVDAGRAEDAVQIALLRAYQSFSGGEIPRQPSAWLSAITRNAAIDQQRRRGPVDPVAEPGRDASSPSVASIAESRAELRDVLRDVAALPEHEREALLMRATVGAGHEAIGAQLSVSPGQARQLLHRARRRLREVAAVLLPAWLAFRVSQARAAVTTLAAAPSETVLSTKGAALALAAAATVGGGGAALQATRAPDRSAPAEATRQPARGPSAAVASSGAASAVAANASGATSTSTVSSREPGADRPGAGAADARNDPRDDAARDRSSTTHAPGAASHPSTTTGASHPGDDEDEDRRPERGTSSSGSGGSGSSGRDDDEDDDRGTAGGTSNSGSSGSGRDEDDQDDDRESGSGSGSGSQSTANGENSSTSGKREPADSSGSSDAAKVEDRAREQDDDRSDDEQDERSGRSAEDE